VILKFNTSIPQSQIFVNLDTPFQQKCTDKVNGIKVNLDGSKSKFLENEDLSLDLDFTSQHC